MKVTIHRGNEQIGGSCIEIADGKTRLIFDLGSPLDVELSKASFEKVKKFLPEVKGLFKGDNEKAPDAIFISHTHPDHAAFLSYVKPGMRVLMSKTSRVATETINMFLFNFGKTDYNVEEIEGHHDRTIPINIGDFEVMPYDVDHSAPGSLAFVIKHKKENKTLVYTGDVRAHGKKGALLEMFGKKFKDNPPDYMIMEGTMVGNERKGEELTEQELELRIAEELKRRTEPVLANFSITNGDRLIGFLNACYRAKYELVIDPGIAYMYEKYHELGWKLKDLAEEDSIKVVNISGNFNALEQGGHGDFKKKISNKIIEPSEAFSKPNRVVVFRESHINVKYFGKVPFPKNTIIMMSKWFERPYPGQEEAYENYKKFAAERGIEIQEHIWHVSGHAYTKDLKKLVDLVNPGEIIPIHTEHPEEFERVFAGQKIHRFQDGVPEDL